MTESTFKVGQRVKMVRKMALSDRHTGLEGDHIPIGAIGTVIDGPTWPGTICVVMDGYVPLTDPGADAFMERMRKLKPYDEPKVAPALTVTRQEETK
jgi:hypothetical protein